MARIRRIGRPNWDACLGIIPGLLAFALLAGGCTAGATSEAGVSPQTVSPAVSPGSPSASPTGAGEQHPDPSVPVDWGNGRDTPGMKVGVPDPPGWYDHAFGGPTSERILYLTFDDGPLPPHTDELLRLLDRYRAQATFFVTGVQARANPTLLREVAARGHALGNHTWDHPDLVALSESKVRESLSAVIRQVGAPLGPCMRPPYGLIDTKVAEVAASLGEIPIMWTGHAADWDNPAPDRIVADLKQATRPGAVLLLHDGGGTRRNTVAAVGQLLPWWREQGYRLETVPACRRPTKGG